MLEPHESPPSKSSYPLGFKIASWVSGCFTMFLLLVIPAVSDPLGNSDMNGTAIFCILTYLFIQFSAAAYYHSQTTRAGVYFWLLVFFPIWSVPAALALRNALVYVIWHWLI